MTAQRFLEERLATIRLEREKKEAEFCWQRIEGQLTMTQFEDKMTELYWWEDRQRVAIFTDLERIQAEFTAAKGEAT